uniref:Uncharacterized protein n=1 Tax=Arundo donax TaxID=35708 RepID=A0A0A9HTT3_ARUDO
MATYSEAINQEMHEPSSVSLQFYP